MLQKHIYFESALGKYERMLDHNRFSLINDSFPTKIKECLALVKATLTLLGQSINCSPLKLDVFLHFTSDKMIISFSPPYTMIS